MSKKITELRLEKEKEVNEIRQQYNSLKEEVRTYERILPTLTFLNELNLQIATIPTYEDIFLSLRTKLAQLEEVNTKHSQYVSKTEETLRTLKQNEENSIAKQEET